MLPSSPSDARFAILDCEDDPKWDGHERLWLDSVRRDGEQWDVLRVWRGELPRTIDAYRGCVLTGSHHSVNDPSLPWLEPLFRFARESVAASDGPQLFGGCFGLQVLARALGGRVESNPDGRFAFGTDRIVLEPAFAATWYAPPQAGPLDLLVSHGEQATALPPGAIRLARSRRATNEVFAVGTRVLAVQGHPEMAPRDLTDVILPSLRAERRLTAEEEARALAEVAAPLHGAPLLAAIRRFLDGPPDRAGA